MHGTPNRTLLMHKSIICAIVSTSYIWNFQTPSQGVPPNAALMVTAPVTSQASTGQRLFLALVLRAGAEATVVLPPATAPPVPTATNADAHAGAQEQAEQMLFLPLVADTTVQRDAAPSATPVPTEQPTATPVTTALAVVTAPSTTTDQPGPEGNPAATPSATPTSATVPNQHAQQPLQALLEQINGLLARGMLNAAQGQHLREPITGVMQLPIVTQGHAPPNPTPGQRRPWQKKMQTFSDQVNGLINSGVLSAAQGQPLLDQAQAIIQTLARHRLYLSLA